MILYMIALGFMVFTLIAKWFSVTMIEQKRTKLVEANELQGQAKFRLKAAVQEVTTFMAEIDKYKRKIKTSQRKVERLQTDFQKYHSKAVQKAEIDAEKLRLMSEMNKRKGIP